MPRIRSSVRNIRDPKGNRVQRKAVTRLLDWAKVSGVAYIVFHMIGDRCDDAIFSSSNSEVFAGIPLIQSGDTSRVLDIQQNRLWLLAARCTEDSSWRLPVTWYLLFVDNDVLIPAPGPVVAMMLNGRRKARAA